MILAFSPIIEKNKEFKIGVTSEDGNLYAITKEVKDDITSEESFNIVLDLFREECGVEIILEESTIYEIMNCPIIKDGDETIKFISFLLLDGQYKFIEENVKENIKWETIEELDKFITECSEDTKKTDLLFYYVYTNSVNSLNDLLKAFNQALDKAVAPF